MSRYDAIFSFPSFDVVLKFSTLFVGSIQPEYLDRIWDILLLEGGR